MRTTALFLLLLFLIGCGSSENVARLTDATYPALPEGEKVEITTGDIDEPYEEVAVLVVGPKPSWLPQSGAEEVAAMNERLREEARQLGAHAVVRVSYEVTTEHPRATGTAIRLGSR